MTDETPITPLFAYPALGPQLKIQDIARDIAAAGVPLELARSRAVLFARHRMIHVRESGQRTSPNLFEFSDSAAAVVLSAIQDSGVADHEILQAASMALYGWSPKARQPRDWTYEKDGRLPRHPIDQAVVGVATGESWIFIANVYRVPETGERIIDCDLMRAEYAFVGHRNIPASAIIRSSVAVTLDEMLLPVARRLLPNDSRN